MHGWWYDNIYDCLLLIWIWYHLSVFLRRIWQKKNKLHEVKSSSKICWRPTAIWTSGRWSDWHYARGVDSISNQFRWQTKNVPENIQLVLPEPRPDYNLQIRIVLPKSTQEGLPKGSANLKCPKGWAAYKFFEVGRNKNSFFLNYVKNLLRWDEWNVFSMFYFFLLSV